MLAVPEVQISFGFQEEGWRGLCRLELKMDGKQITVIGMKASGDCPMQIGPAEISHQPALIEIQLLPVPIRRRWGKVLPEEPGNREPVVHSKRAALPVVRVHEGGISDAADFLLQAGVHQPECVETGSASTTPQIQVDMIFQGSGPLIAHNVAGADGTFDISRHKTFWGLAFFYRLDAHRYRRLPQPFGKKREILIDTLFCSR